MEFFDITSLDYPLEVDSNEVLRISAIIIQSETFKRFCTGFFDSVMRKNKQFAYDAVIEEVEFTWKYMIDMNENEEDDFKEEMIFGEDLLWNIFRNLHIEGIISHECTLGRI